MKGRRHIKRNSNAYLQIVKYFQANQTQGLPSRHHWWDIYSLELEYLSIDVWTTIDRRQKLNASEENWTVCVRLTLEDLRQV